MSFSALQRYARSILVHVPWPHWVVMGMLSLALTVYLLIRKRNTIYGALCLEVTVFIWLFLLDAAFFSRLSNTVHPETGFSLHAELHRFLYGGMARRTEMLANVAVFVPFGFFLSEFLSMTKRFSYRRQIGHVALAAFGLSICIESLQLIFRLGVFEITDLVLNTLGGVIGASSAVVVRRLWERREERRGVTHFRP